MMIEILKKTSFVKGDVNLVVTEDEINDYLLKVKDAIKKDKYKRIPEFFWGELLFLDIISGL